MSRKTIGESPFDSLITTPTEEPEINSSKKPKINGHDNLKRGNGNKQRLTVQISDEVVERAKNAVYWTRGLTLAQLTEQALEKALVALEKNTAIFDDKTGNPLKEKGQPFPERAEELKTGRPIK
jgi:hypothetical protein